VTDDSAFKKQVRARMAETGEKYTVARRIVIEDAAIRAMLHRDMEPAGILRIEIGRTYPLAEARRAHGELEARRTTGSNILLP